MIHLLCRPKCKENDGTRKRKYGMDGDYGIDKRGYRGDKAGELKKMAFIFSFIKNIL
jgi:hypothetical protein